MENIIFIALVAAAFAEIVYLIFNSYRQKRAEKKLISLLKQNEKDFLRSIAGHNVTNEEVSPDEKNIRADMDAITMINFVNKQLSILNDGGHTIEYKVVETADTRNKKRFVAKLFSNLGFKRFVTNHSNGNTNLII